MTTRPPSRRFFLATGMAGALAWPGAAWSQTQDRDVEGGIGGTGIVGILVEAGRLVIAGHAVDLDGETRVQSAFGAVSPTALRAGHSLTVEAGAAGNGQLVARRIDLTYPLVGRVSQVGRGALVVNGVEVRLGDTPNAARAGDRVAVSGLWRGGRVMASRIELAPSAQDLVSGTLDIGAGGRRIGGVSVTRRGLGQARSGSFATAIGEYSEEQGRLRTARATRERFTGAAGPLVRLSVEGWLEPTGGAPGFRIAGLGHSFERNLDLAPFADQRVLFQGGYTGLFDVDTAIRLPDNAAARRALLRRISR